MVRISLVPNYYYYYYYYYILRLLVKFGIKSSIIF